MTQASQRLRNTDPVQWILDNFWIPEDNFITGEPGPRPIDLQQYQIDCLREALSVDERGLFKYSVIVWSDIKKSAKSSLAAAVALWMADKTDWAEIYLIANDLKQADTRVGKYARRAIQYSPTLSQKFRSVGYSIKGDNHSMVDSIPIDPEGEAGSNADMIQFSELWGAQDDSKSRMFSEMTLSPTKFGKSFRWIESYAGYQDESEVLYDLWELGVERGEPIWPDRLYPVTEGEPTPLEVYKNEAARLFCLWNTQPRCPWQNKEYYASERAILLPNEFDRMHRNQWVSNTDTFVPIEWWDACAHPDDMPSIPHNHSLVVAADAAVSDDTFGLIKVGRHPDAKNHPNTICIWWAKAWKPGLHSKIDFQGTEEDPGPELMIRRFFASENIIQLAYDPYQLHDMATRLKKDHLGWIRAFNQGMDRLIADSQFRDMIRERRIWHDGNLDLRDHMKNADAKIDNEDRKVRIVKRVDKLKIDLAVCASMAVHEAMRLNI